MAVGGGVREDHRGGKRVTGGGGGGGGGYGHRLGGGEGGKRVKERGVGRGVRSQTGGWGGG